MESKPTYNDNRLHIECDPAELQTWELMAIEKVNLEQVCLVLCRYVANGSGPVSKDLPDKKPLRKLTRDEKNQLMDSPGFEWLESLSIPMLQSVTRTFIEGATEAAEKKA